MIDTLYSLNGMPVYGDDEYGHAMQHDNMRQTEDSGLRAYVAEPVMPIVLPDTTK